MPTDNLDRLPTRDDSEGAEGPGSNTTARRTPGQVSQMMGQLTKRLPTAEKPRQSRTRTGPLASRERITSLIAALGDPANPLHANAVDELVHIGGPAVPALSELMEPNQPWLASYRAAEAAGRIGDGRAAGALIRALGHPNSNVRWSAVRALTHVGDLRAALELRRVAENDQGRTSWGESVSAAAESALAELRSRSVWGQSLELIKTAVTAVLMILALILAVSVVTTLRGDLDAFGAVDPATLNAAPVLLPTLTATAPLPTSEPFLAATSEVTASVTASTAEIVASTELTGTVLQAANVRPQPVTGNEPIGRLLQGDEIVFIARSPDNQWYLIRLGSRSAESSRINNPDGSGEGWINRALVTAPAGDLPVREVALAPPQPTPTP
jgi:hypothetical protein